VKIVARTQNPLSGQDVTTKMLSGKIIRSNLHSVECHSTELRFEWRIAICRRHETYVVVVILISCLWHFCH